MAPRQGAPGARLRPAAARGSRARARLHRGQHDATLAERKTLIEVSSRARRPFVVLAVAVALSGFGAGCGADDEPEERRIALKALVEELEPLRGQDDVRIGRTQSKSDYPYFSATGILEMSRASGIAHAESAFEQQGWDVIESGNVSHFLGSCTRARKASMVAITYVGWSDMPTNNVYPRLPGRVNVQTLVGREGSNQGWTDVDRDLC